VWFGQVFLRLGPTLVISFRAFLNRPTFGKVMGIEGGAAGS
jgi:hypothetical protein